MQHNPTIPAFYSVVNLPASPSAGTSVKGELVNAIDFVKTLPKEPVAFVFGSHASGPVIVDFTEESISLSQYPVRAGLISCVSFSYKCFNYVFLSIDLHYTSCIQYSSVLRQRSPD